MGRPTLDQNLDPSLPEVLDRVVEVVLRRLSGRVYDLSLAFQGGGLVIRGRSPTYYAKQLAQHAVMAITTVPILANKIEVRAS